MMYEKIFIYLNSLGGAIFEESQRYVAKIIFMLEKGPKIVLLTKLLSTLANRFLWVQRSEWTCMCTYTC